MRLPGQASTATATLSQGLSTQTPYRGHSCKGVFPQPSAPFTAPAIAAKLPHDAAADAWPWLVGLCVECSWIAGAFTQRCCLLESDRGEQSRGSGGPGVDLLAVALGHNLDQALTQQLLDGSACQAAVDLRAA